MRIRQIREREHMSRAELADKAGITRQTVYNLEVGATKNASIRTLASIAKALGVSIDAIFSPQGG